MRAQEWLVEILEKMRCGKGKNVQRNVETENIVKMVGKWIANGEKKIRPERSMIIPFFEKC